MTDTQNQGASYLWIIGIAISCVGSFLATLGLALQKLAHKKIAREKRLEKESEMEESIDDAFIRIDKNVDGLNLVDSQDHKVDDPNAGIDHSDQVSINGSNIDPNTGIDHSDQLSINSEPTKKSQSQKLLNDNDEESSKLTKKKKKKRRYYCEPLWIGGVVSMFLDSILDVLSFGLAATSILAPLAALTLVYNTCLAPKLLGETVGKRDIISTFIILIGTVIVISCAEHNTPIYTIDELKDLMYTVPVLIYFILFLVVLISIYTFIKLYENDKIEKTRGVTGYYALSFPVLAGLCGGTSVLFSKASMELIKSSIVKTNQFVFFLPYVFLFFLGLSLFLQLQFLNRGLALFDSLFVVPNYQCIWILSSVTTGGVYFQEFSNLSTLRIVGFFTGVIVILSGVLYLKGRISLMSDPPRHIDKLGDSERLIPLLDESVL